MAIRFDGTDDAYDYGSLPDLMAPSAFAVSFWLNYTSTSVNDVFFGRSGANGRGFACRSVTAANDMALWFGGGVVSHGRIVGGLTTGSWVHWGFVFDGTQADNSSRCKVYKNGVQQSLSFTGTVPASVVSAAADLPKSMQSDISGQFAAGQMSDLFVWAVALSAQQIANQRFLRRPIISTGLQIWIPFDYINAAGTATPDYSGVNTHGNTVTPGTLTAGPIGRGAPALAA
jgi:hypothetical protein